MSNLYQPWEGRSQGGHPTDRSQGGHPTEQFWRPGTSATPPSGPAPSGQALPQQPGPAHPEPRKRKALGWAAGLTLAALLAGGGTAAAITLAGQSSGMPVPNAAGAPAAATGGTGEAALLNATLSNASAPGALVTASQAAGSAPPAAGTAAHLCLRARRAARAARRAGLPRVARAARLAAGRCRVIRHRVFRFFLLRGVDGQFTIRAAAGLKTIAFERGVIEAVSQGTSIQVKASDGTTWTWDLASSTVVRDRGGKVSENSLSDGEPVWVGGHVTGGTRDARLVVVRPPVPGGGG